MKMMRAKLAAVIPGADAQRAALGTELDDGGKPRPHRRRHRRRGQAVDDDLEHRPYVVIERGLHRALERGAISFVG